MIIEQTLDQLQELKLHGMAAALEEQRGIPDVQSLTFEDRFALPSAGTLQYIENFLQETLSPSIKVETM